MSYISTMMSKRLDEVIVWERNDVENRTERYLPAPYYYYVDDPAGKHNTIFDTPVKKLVFDSPSDYYNSRKKHTAQNIRMWESDISPELRVLSQQYHEQKAPTLNISFLDIEVDYDPELGFSSAQNPYAPINAISLYHRYSKHMIVMCVPSNKDPETWTAEKLELECNRLLPIPTKFKTTFLVFDTERDLLRALLKEIKNSDLLCGWNSDLFDFPYIAKRIEIVLGQSALRQLTFPGAPPPVWADVVVMNNKHLKIEMVGRLLADYMLLYKKYQPGEKPSFKLSAISDDELIDESTGEPLLPKLEYTGTLFDLYHKNFAFFIRYNIRDCEILDGFEDKLGYVDLANQIYHLSCGQFKHVTGTLKLAELAIVNFCHHTLNKVVKNVTEPPIDRQIDGALVLLPQVGLHEFVGSIDINSLYPSAIRSINISIETLIGQFNGFMDATIEINKRSEKTLTLVFQDEQEVTMAAAEWREWLIEQKYAISGYGTVFNQNTPGIIPAVLTDWFATRKKYQAMKRDAENKAATLLSKYQKETTDNMTPDDVVAYRQALEEASYYDRLQYVYKIKLNSLYGAMANLYFRFFNLNMAESTTATGRMIVKHQCRVVNKILSGKYDVDFPLYETVKDATDAGHPPSAALHGPVFNGKLQSDSVIYGDSVSGDTMIETDTGPVQIEQLFGQVDYVRDNKEYSNCNVQALTYDKEQDLTRFGAVKYVMRHLVSKPMYRVWINNSQYVDVTEDHSLISYDQDSNEFSEITSSQLSTNDHNLICRKNVNNTDKDFDIVKCCRIDPLPTTVQYVYDIEVDDTHTFFANNILVHNTDSTYFKTEMSDIETSIIIADGVAAEVNESYPAFMEDMFLCTTGYSSIIKAGREIVSDRGIFVDKKRYILHLVDLDGKSVDKMKVMGLDTKKSTLPRVVSAKLNGFVEDLLRGQDWESVAKRIVQYKVDLQNTDDIMELGLPKGVNNVEHYTNEYKMFGDGARLPGHVAAAIHYNEALVKFGDKTSPKISSGMKIKVFYLVGKHGKFKSIAIPTDIEMVPEWFGEQFSVDKVAHIERLVDNPLSNILKAIGKVTPSARSLKIESALEF